MPRRKLKIQVDSGKGEKISITVQGNLSREHIAQLIDFIETIGNEDVSKTSKNLQEMTKFEKLKLAIDRKFPSGWFTSQDAMIAYEDTFDEPLRLSTVSTYLSRLVDQDVLIRMGSFGMRKYRRRLHPPQEEESIT